MSLNPLDVCACPRCKGTLSLRGEELHCGACGSVGRVWHGILDFLAHEDRISCAAGGVLDLAKDREVAEEAASFSRSSGADYVTLSAHVADIRNNQGKPVHLRRTPTEAEKRYEKWYWTVEKEVGARHGQAILAKIDAHLADKGAAKATGEWALEGGGGMGGYVPGFAERFRKVVFFDGSLVNVFLAKKLAEETGLTNVIFVHGNAETLPFKGGVFDFAHQNGIVEHVEHPEAMVKEALRVLSSRGTYFCLSPNRYPITPEPHFKLPLFGAFPRSVRKVLLPRVRGNASEAGTDLRSLRQLRQIFASAGTTPEVFFLPRTLPWTARTTPVRRLVKSALAMPGLGDTVSFLLNGPLLPVMPYHCAVVHRAPAATAN